MDTTADTVADQESEGRRRAAWVLGDHARIAPDLTAELGSALAAAAGVRPGDRVLDVAADAVGSQALPFPDGAFDVVLVRAGMVLPPRHRSAADELVRVCRQGGTIGALAWAADGFAAAIVRTVAPYAPEAPGRPRAPAPRALRALLGDRVVEVRVRRGAATTDRYPTPEAWRDHWKNGYGPVAAVYRHLRADPDEVAALDRDLASVAARFDCGADATVLRWDYLILTARRAGPGR